MAKISFEFLRLLYATGVLIRVKNLRPGTPLFSPKRASAPFPVNANSFEFFTLFYATLAIRESKLLCPGPWGRKDDGGRGGGEGFLCPGPRLCMHFTLQGMVMVMLICVCILQGYVNLCMHYGYVTLVMLTLWLC